MLELLTPKRFNIAHNTISYNTFFLIVRQHLVNKQPMSHVRMADGEKIMINHYLENKGDLLIHDVFKSWEEGWAVRMGYVGCTVNQAYNILMEAEKLTTYFAPSQVGLLVTNHLESTFDLYDHFPPRDKYVDHFFINDIKKEQIKELYKIAKKITIIHANPWLGEYFKSNNTSEYEFEYVHLSNWDQVDSVVETVSNSDSNLVLVCGSKIVGPKIAQSNKVCLDIGNTIDRWNIQN